jgi:hypothetical protein
MHAVTDTVRIVLIGLCATVIMDAWLFFLARLGQPFSGFGLIGRWVGHMWHGRFVHTSIAQSPPIRGESALGWLTHYTVGVAYAALLVMILGLPWLQHPTLLPTMLFGLATVAVPFALMQPAMGAGFASSRTRSPNASRLRSLANHVVFGTGLYLGAIAIERV